MIYSIKKFRNTNCVYIMLCFEQCHESTGVVYQRNAPADLILARILNSLLSAASDATSACCVKLQYMTKTYGVSH
jgi:hypothetical protein